MVQRTRLLKEAIFPEKSIERVPMPDTQSSPKSTNTPDARQQAIQIWLQTVLGTADYDLQPASADASFRRYFRTRHEGESFIIMDAPPDKEDSHPFVQIAQLMHQAGLNAPRVLASDLENGFLLLTDMGMQTYMSALSESTADELMSDAIDALIVWQLATESRVLPAYDEALLQRELDLFPDWYVGRHLGTELTKAQREDWASICAVLLQSALAQPRVFVHRDYMPRNLMVCDPNPGILDFQDAVEGPIAYDVLSLFKDAFLSWPAEKIENWRHEYWQKALAAALPVGSEPDFVRWFDLIGVQRHLKVLGIFARIRYRDGKSHYLEDAPRFVRYIRDVVPAYSELHLLLDIFDDLGMEG